MYGDAPTRGRLVVPVLVVLTSLGMLGGAWFFTPEFVEQHLSPDGRLTDATHGLIALYRFGLVFTAVLVTVLWVTWRPIVRHFSRYAIHRGQVADPTMLSPRRLAGGALPRRVQIVLWIALAVWFVAVEVSFYSRIEWPRFFQGEYGVLENGTVVLYLLAGIFALVLAFRRGGQGAAIGFHRWWMALLAAFCILVALEETNWGQVYFHFRTPELIDRVNYQHDFSLHNIWLPPHLPLPQGYWANVLLWWLALAGAFGPSVLWVSRRLRRVIWEWEVPVPSLLARGFFAAAVLIPHDRMMFGWQMRPSEMREFSLAVAFALWVYSERTRLGLYAERRVEMPLGPTWEEAERIAYAESGTGRPVQPYPTAILSRPTKEREASQPAQTSGPVDK